MLSTICLYGILWYYIILLYNVYVTYVHILLSHIHIVSNTQVDPDSPAAPCPSWHWCHCTWPPSQWEPWCPDARWTSRWTSLLPSRPKAPRLRCAFRERPGASHTGALGRFKALKGWKNHGKTWTCSMLGEKLVASFWKFHDTPENHQFREDENWLKQAYQKNRCCLTGLSTKWGTILYFLNLLTLHSLRQILAEQKNASSARRNWECPTGSPNKGIP